MVAATTREHRRELTAAERYFAFVDQVTPATVVLSADLAVCLPADVVRRRWSEFVRARPRSRMQVHDDLTVSVADPQDARFTHAEIDVAGWDAAIAPVLERPYGFDRPPECVYWTAPAEGRSRVSVLAHHSVTDGRRGLRELQAFLRLLAGRPVDEQPVPGPPRLREDFPWSADPRALVELLRSMKARQDAAGDADPAHWPAAAERGPVRVARLVHDEVTSRALTEAGRARGIRLVPTLAAVWMHALVETLRPAGGGVVQLAVPTDITQGPAAHTTMPAVAVVTNRYRVGTGSTWDLAATVQEHLMQALEAGEGELFLRLSRAALITDLAAGAETVRHSLRTIPPSLSFTNIGSIDHTDDPDWVEAFTAYFAPGPHQVLFVDGVRYRGRIVQTLCTDAARVPAAAAAAVLDTTRTLIATLPTAEGTDR